MLSLQTKSSTVYMTRMIYMARTIRCLASINQSWLLNTSHEFDAIIKCHTYSRVYNEHGL